MNARSSSGGPVRPRSGVQLRVDDEGEVLARGNVVMEGYWEQPDETAKAIPDGWFHTGDGGVIDDDDYLSISDRKKDVIISGGENVSSIEVEDCLFSHPAVAEVAAIGVPDEKWGETVKALVVLAPGAEATEAGPHRALPRAARALQVPDVGRVPRRAGAYRHRQAPEVQAPRPVLGGPGPPGRLTVSDAPSVSRVVGQLRYLFEERPELSSASAAELARWLSPRGPHGPRPGRRTRSVARRRSRRLPTGSTTGSASRWWRTPSCSSAAPAAEHLAKMRTTLGVE